MHASESMKTIAAYIYIPPTCTGVAETESGDSSINRCPGLTLHHK